MCYLEMDALIPLLYSIRLSFILLKKKKILYSFLKQNNIYAHAGKTVCLIDTDLGQASSIEWAGIRGEQKPHIQVCHFQNYLSVSWSLELKQRQDNLWQRVPIQS